MTYLERTFWPHDMAVFYPFPTQIPVWLILGTFLLIIVITTIVVVMVKRMPFLFVGWMWYAVTIAPVIGIIQVSVYPYAMADRYHYLPSVGIVVMLAWGIPFLIKSEQARKKILFPVGIAFLAIMAFLSWDQCGYWKNSIELWKHALEVTKNNYPAHNNFGLALFAEGKIEEAINHYNKAISIAPEYVYTYNNRGIIYGERGQYKLAIEDFNNAIRIIPTFADAYYNLGFTYDKRGQYQLAIENYNKAIRLKPDYTEAYMNRGIAYLKRGNNTLGCRDEQKACALGNCKTLESAKGIGYCP
jgi:tetratricopeptide (TPR) repeat protein